MHAYMRCTYGRARWVLILNLSRVYVLIISVGAFSPHLSFVVVGIYRGRTIPRQVSSSPDGTGRDKKRRGLGGQGMSRAEYAMFTCWDTHTYIYISSCFCQRYSCS